MGKQENWVYHRIGPNFEDGYVCGVFYSHHLTSLGFRKSIQVTGAGGELVFLIIKSMPDEYRTRIAKIAQAVYPHDWKSASLGQMGKIGFRADHFCFWNRYCENVGCGMNVIYIYNLHLSV